MRNWNNKNATTVSSSIGGFYSTYEELKLIDAAFCSIARLSFYSTYEELKHGHYSTSFRKI